MLDGAGAAAVGAGFRAGARSRAGALAVRALFHALQGDLFLAAEGRLLEGDGQPRAQALPPLGTGAGPRPAEATAEKAAEDVPQVPEVEASVKPAAEAAALLGRVVGVHPGEAELVVPGTLVAVAEDLICLVDLLEPGLGGLVAGVQVRMVLFSQLPVCLLDIRVRGGLGYAEDFVIVTFVFCHARSHPIITKHSKWGGEHSPSHWNLLVYLF